MDIAILHYSLAPVVGGVERLIEDQARALRALGHCVCCVDSAAKFRAWLRRHPKARNAVSRPAVLIHNVLTMPFDLAWTRELTALTRQRPDVLWVNWVHDVCACNPAYRQVEWREPLPRALHVAVSRVRQREWASVSGLKPRQIQVISNGIDEARVLGLTARVAGMQLDRHDVVLLQPARLVARKNIELSVNVLAALRKQGIDAVVVVTAALDPHQQTSVAYLGRLQRLARRLGVHRSLLFAGQPQALSEDDVRSLYSVADGLFFPSLNEGFGLPLLEALAHRLPIFCADLKVHREVLGPLATHFNTSLKPERISARILQELACESLSSRRALLRRTFSMHRICREQLLPLLQCQSAPSSP